MYKNYRSIVFYCWYQYLHFSNALLTLQSLLASVSVLFEETASHSIPGFIY